MGAPFEFEGVVRLTRMGAGHLLFTMLVGFAAINTGNNALYMALAVMLGSLILSGVASKGGLKRLRVDLLELDDAWAGRPAWGVIEVVNLSRLWNLRDLVVTSSDLESPLYLDLVPRRASVRLEGRFLFQRRGRVQLRTADLYTRYPFGLFLKKRRVHLKGEAIIFPRLTDNPREPRRLRGAEGDVPNNDRVGPGTEIFAFRDYRSGDSLRHVHWKKSASLGRWIMRETELEAGRSIRVALDPVVPPGTSEEVFEDLVSEATTLVHHALELGLDVTLTVPPATLKARGGSGRNQMLEALALVEMRVGTAPASVFEPGCFVFSLRGRHESRTA